MQIGIGPGESAWDRRLWIMAYGLEMRDSVGDRIFMEMVHCFYFPCGCTKCRDANSRARLAQIWGRMMIWVPLQKKDENIQRVIIGRRVYAVRMY
jgi:hypothetical protein